MIRAAALLAVLSAVGPADACPAPAPGLLMHSCWGEARAELLLVPDEALAPPEADAERWTVTGAYTGRDTRAGGSPNPVGLFVDGGHVVNQTLAPMDGILLIADGRLSLHHRARVPWNGTVVDLSAPSARVRFAREAAADGVSVAQSHLIIVDGRLDVRDRPDAPRFTRRMLFEDAHGFGLWQSAAALTLHDAGAELIDGYAPRMALNLDMGSYDLCIWEIRDESRNCGYVPRRPMQDFSNLLAVTLRRSGRT